MKKKGLSYQDQAGFKLPEGYFEQFEDRMMRKIRKEKPAPVIPFKVPEDYFENFQQEMMTRIEKQEKEEVKVVSLSNRRAISYIAGIAAVLAVLFTSAVFQNVQQTGFEDLDALAVENYILESLEFENTEDTPLFQDKEIGFAISSDPEIEREALLEYLKENIEEPSLLLNEE